VMSCTLHVDLFVDGELPVDFAEVPLDIAPRTSMQIGIDGLFPGFTDLAWAHRFGPLTYDAIAIRLMTGTGQLLSEDVHLPGGLARAVERDLGLTASVSVDEEAGSAEVVVQTRRLAQFVNIDVAGWEPSDGWFDLVPGQRRSILLRRVTERAQFVGSVRCLNGNMAAVRAEAGQRAV
jgi:beta-mannosidase